MINDVEQYYDSNTARFLSLGKGGHTGVIHRAIWAPEVRTREEAMHYVHALIAKHLSPLFSAPGARERETTSPGVILDLGCGVGASIAYLNRIVPATYIGVTISSVQARMAAERLSAEGLPRPSSDASGEIDAPVVIQGDFCADQTYEKALGTRPIRAAYMVESMVHAPDVDSVLRNLAERTIPGGILVIVDDIPTSELMTMAESDRRVARWIAEFRRGWRVKTFLTTEQLDQKLRSAGFHLDDTTDLTEYVDLNRPRDRLIQLVVGLGRWMPVTAPWWHNLLGGNALQRLQTRGLLRYQVRAYTRR